MYRLKSHVFPELQCDVTVLGKKQIKSWNLCFI